MKTLPSILAAALLVAGTSVALAQGNTAIKPGTGLSADKNPSAMHNPAAGNPAGTKWVKHPNGTAKAKPKMKSSPVSATHRKHGKMMKMDSETSK
jgi:hypothetical protein